MPVRSINCCFWYFFLHEFFDSKINIQYHKLILRPFFSICLNSIELTVGFSSDIDIL